MSRRRITAALGAAAVTLILATGGASGRAGAPGQQAPVDKTPPSISGSAQVANVLTASTGTWQGKALKFAYQWLRCDAVGASCSAISGATGSSKMLSSADIASTLRVIVTASNKNGSTAATSAQTAAVASAASPPPPPPPPSTTTAVAPVETSLPVVSGTAQQNQNLTTSTGSWSGTTPMTYTYQWQRCDSGGASCAPISGATAANYVLTTADVGSSMRASVTASNSAGSATASSTATAPVSSVTPSSNPTAPVCSGCYVENKLDGSMPSNWVYWAGDGSNGHCSHTAEGSYSWLTDGVFNGALRLHTPASQYTAANPSDCSNSTSWRLDYGNPLVHASEGDSTWYRVRMRWSGQPIGGQWDWAVEWHNDVSVVPGTVSTAWGVWSDGGLSYNTPGTNPRLVLRPAGGPNTAPVYNNFQMPPGSLIPNHWYDLVTHIVWGVDSSTGHVDAWVDGQRFVSANVPTLLYNSSTGQRDRLSFSMYNYHYDVNWATDRDFDEVLIGPTAASIGFTP
jgi:hypothetical protein